MSNGRDLLTEYLSGRPFSSPPQDNPFNDYLKIIPPMLPPISPPKIRITTLFENSLREELIKISNQNLDHSLARVLPSLNSLSFADGKEIETAILYIDIRNSSSITNSHIPENAAKMYKMFHRAMIWAGKKYHGQVGGFAGDRIMIVFPFGTEDAPRTNAAKTAIYMQHVLQNILNPIFQSKFKHPLECGIGVDFGTILVVRVGQQGTGNNERIWAGNAANYASKLADKGTGIFVSKKAYEGIDPSLKTTERTWVPYKTPDGTIHFYRYTGTSIPV